jgi:hypothetical protein
MTEKQEKAHLRTIDIRTEAISKNTVAALNKIVTDQKKHLISFYCMRSSFLPFTISYYQYQVN